MWVTYIVAQSVGANCERDAATKDTWPITERKQRILAPSALNKLPVLHSGIVMYKPPHALFLKHIHIHI
jgi:hypothetical protein